MSIIILYILVFFIMYLCYLNLYVRENLVNNDEWRKYFKKCDGENCEMKPVVGNIDCKGDWLPWSLPDFNSLNNNSKKTLGENSYEFCKPKNQGGRFEEVWPSIRRQYRIVQPRRNQGKECNYEDGAIQIKTICDKLDDDCIDIRKSYYNTENPSFEEMSEKCQMENCIPPTKITSNCDGDITYNNENGTREKRCPWICDPKRKKMGDGVNSCIFDSDCRKCTPDRLISKTNCGEKITCPNTRASDGCGSYNNTEIDFFWIDREKQEKEKEQEQEKVLPVSWEEYKKYSSDRKRDSNINNLYNTEKREPSPLYKSVYDYSPYNSLHTFFK